MPYATNDSAPSDVKQRFSGHCLTVWRQVWNDTYERHADEQRAFATAETAGKLCMEAAMTKKTLAVKFSEASDSTIEGLAIPFSTKDMDGESFSPDTEYCLDWFPNEGRPILYHHGFDDAIKTAVIGRQTTLDQTDEGFWIKAELDKASRYYSRVKELIEKGALGFSSGAVDHLFTSTKDGVITRWPWVELSLTPTPANPNKVTYAVKASDALAHLVVSDSDIPEALKEIASEDGLENEPFAEHGRRVKADVEAFAERTESRIEARVKAGRELSAANLTTLRQIADSLAPFVDSHRRIMDLVERNDPSVKQAAHSEWVRFLQSEAARLGVPV